MTSTNDGKDVKTNQASGPKGKLYYIELYKSLDARLTEGGVERTKHLCVAWRSVHSLCQHSAPSTHTHLINWLQRHTARAVLQTEWPKPERKDDRKSLVEAIDTFIGQVAETPRDGGPLLWEAQLVARGEWFKRVLDKPWDHPVLMLLLNPNGTPPTDDEVLEWLKEERGVTFVVRLHTLVGEKCEDIAVSLASAVMERARTTLPPVADSDERTEASAVANARPTFADKLKEEAGFTPDVWETLTDIEFVLLHKRDSKRCIALAKQTPLLEAYPLIERLQKRLEASPREKRLWKNAREVAILIAQVVIARCMVVSVCEGAARTALYCCARLLARLLAARLPAAADALAAQAPTARHLHTLAQAVDKQLSPTNEEMKPYVCELYVRAITAGMNELERLKLKTEKEAEARSMEKTLASWFVQLGTVLSRSDRIACECTLTAFSLHPSQKMFERIEAAPHLARLTDANESKEETVKSEFGSWANDSRSQTNLVKTSETLKMKHTQNQTNVLSTAIFNEGEALGLSPELCQDIAVLLAGPRVKTLSWDMDRKLLLEHCRAYSEVTHEGTRALTRELKYLNLDLQQYQHLPEERDDDENDPYYGIERGYEHLAVLEEREEIWKDADSPETETASSIEEDYLVPQRKKKTKRLPFISDEDSDPLSFAVETKRIQKKKERPHSKERSKGKKNQDLVDPLDFNAPCQNQSQPTMKPTIEIHTKPKKEPKEKKERKKKEKVPKVIGGKRSALASLIGMKVGKAKKKSKDLSNVATLVTDSDYDTQGKHSLTSINADGNELDAIQQTIFGDSPKQIHSGMIKNEYTMHMGTKMSSSYASERSLSNLTRMQYRPQTPNNVRQQSPSNFNKVMSRNYKNYSDNVRANLSKLVEFRRQTDNIQKKLALQNMPYTPPRQPAIIKPDIPLHTNISPKSVAIPEIPKSYINKEQTEKMAEMIRAEQKPDLKDSVIQFAKKTSLNKSITVPKKMVANTISASSSADSRIKTQHSNMRKMTDFVNPSYDRLMAEIAERQSRGQETMKSVQSQYQAVHSQQPVQKSYNVLTAGQRDFQNFLKEYEQKKYDMATPQAIDMTSKSTRKPIMPVSRVTPVVPYVSKSEAKIQYSKQQAAKKPEPTLNTFSRLSYHKNKQNEMKNKNQTSNPLCTTKTYQEVSSELDEIIKEHQRAQMKVIQAKRDNADKLMNLANAAESMNKTDVSVTKHPLLSNLLQNPTPAQTCRNENQLKNNSIHYTSPPPHMTRLSEKDNNDLVNLLRQKANFNNLSHNTTNINSKPSSSTANKPQSGSIYTSNSDQSQQLTVPPSQSESVTSSLESKIINVISNTLLKPGTHEINKSLSVNTKSASDSVISKPVDFTQNTNKKNVTSRNQMENKYVPESSKSEWQAVMYDLLRHKTPTRGPNALDMALNKSSFETAYEKSVKEASTLSQSQRAIEKSVASKKQQEKVDRSKPVITSVQNVLITKKGIKLQNEVSNPKEAIATDIKNRTKPPGIAISEKLKTRNTSEIKKKLPQEMQRKHLTYLGPKNCDPFISGIPNSDYDLLEELMDDDLRKEIGELSSDDESYNAAAQSFLKPTNSSEKRVSVQINKSIVDPAIKSTSNVQCSNDDQSTNEAAVRPVTLQPVSYCDNKSTQIQPESISLTEKQIVHKNLNNNALMPSSSQNDPIPSTTTSNAQNQAYLKSNQITSEPNIYVSPVLHSAPVQNVVVIGQEVVYSGYTNVQTAVQGVHSLTSNAYVAVNNTPTMTLYQTAHYNNPLVIGTAITAPVVNNVPCISIQPNVNKSVVKPCYPAVTVELQPSVADHQISALTYDTHIEMENEDRLHDYSQSNFKLQEDTKASERKVLSEVQDVAMTEIVDNIRTHKIDHNAIVNIKKDIVNDSERLKKKRLAILNREICHRCGEDTIPLTYSPLPVKIHTVLEIPLSCSFSSVDEDKKKILESEEDKLLALIKNNLQDLSNSINEVPSPATPDSNDSKENKSFASVPYRRILLRSSNKITPKSNIDRGMSDNSTFKKSKPKTKLKSEVAQARAIPSGKAKNFNKTEKEATIRASKRLRSRKVRMSPDAKKLIRQELQELNTKPKTSLTDKRIDKLPKKIKTEYLEYQDIESELKGSKILKTVDNKDELDNDKDEFMHCKVETEIPGDRINEKVFPEVPITQVVVLEQPSQKTLISASKIHEDTISENPILQKTSLFEHTSQNAVDKHETITAVKVDENNIPLIDDKTIKKAIAVTRGIETTEYVFNESSDDVSDNILNKQDIETDKKVISGNMSDSQHTFNSKALTEVPLLSALTTDLMNSNDVVKCAAKKCDSGNTICESNKIDLQEKDNIDLDMSVTCEEVPKQKLSPTFGTIKTARSKSINANKTKGIKVDKEKAVNYEEVANLSSKFNNTDLSKVKHIKIDEIESISMKVCDNGINMHNKSSEVNEKFVAVSNKIEVSKKIVPCIETVNLNPTPKSRIEIETSKVGSIPFMSSISHTEKLATLNITADKNDDVIIDYNENAEATVPIKSTTNSANCEQQAVNSVTNNAHHTGNASKHEKEKGSPSNTPPHSKDLKTQVDTNTRPNSNSNMKELSGMSQNFLENIHIEHLPPNNPMTNRVRVSLPNGRRVIVTVGREVCVTLDSLFAFPTIKEALLNENNRKKRYVMYVQQTAIVNNSEPDKILSVQLNKIQDMAPSLGVPQKPIETIDLLSDEEDVIDKDRQVFVTEYGNFTAFPMDKNLFLKHQDKLKQKPQILLKKMDAKSSSTKKKSLTIATLNENQNVRGIMNDTRNTLVSIDNKQLVTSELHTNIDLPKDFAQKGASPEIPKQFVKGLMEDIETVLASDLSKKSSVIPDIVEIDDSSNDSLNQGKPTETIPEDKTINKLKHELLKELGVAVQTRNSSIFLKNKLSNGDNMEIIDEIKPQIHKRRKMPKLSIIPSGKSCPFDDLDEKVQLQIIKRKCAIKMVRCDELARKYEQDVLNAMNQSAQVFDDELITINEDYAMLNVNENNTLDVEERSRSPVIELTDVLVSLENKTVMYSASTRTQVTLHCEADWYSTKSILRCQGIHSAPRCNDFENNVSDDRFIDKGILRLQDVDSGNMPHSDNIEYDKYTCVDRVNDHAFPLSCKASWLTTKRVEFEIHNNVPSIRLETHILNYDVEMCNDSSINKVIPLVCKSNCLFTKPMLHLENANVNTIKQCLPSENIQKLTCDSDWLTTKYSLYIQGVADKALSRSNFSQYNGERYRSTFTDSTISIPCEASWLLTKSTLHIQSANSLTVERSGILDYDYEMRNNILSDYTVPLSCKAKWLATKPMLRSGGINDISVIQSKVFDYGKRRDDKQVPKDMRIRCKANWLTTKSAIHRKCLSTVKTVSDKNILKNVVTYNMAPLICEASWLTTKTTLHLEVTHTFGSNFLRPADVCSNDKVKNCGRSATCSVANDTISLQRKLLLGAPSLASLVLEKIQSTNIIQRLVLLNNDNTRYRIISLKRKSSSQQNYTACKIPKIYKTPEKKIHHKSSSDAAITSASGSEEVLSQNPDDNKLPQEKRCTNKNLKTSLCATKCDDIRNLNIHEQVSCVKQVKNEYENIKRTVLNRNVIIDSVKGNRALFQPSINGVGAYEYKEIVDTNAVYNNNDISDHLLFVSPDVLNEQSDENFMSLRESRSPSPIIDISNVIVPGNATLSQFDEHTGHDSQSVVQNKQSLETEKILDELENINFIDSNITKSMSSEAKKAEDVCLEIGSLQNEQYGNESKSVDCDDLEAKLAEIVGESLMETNSTTQSQSDETKKSDSEEYEIIRVILGNESFTNTDGKIIDIVANEEPQNCFENGDTHEFLKIGDHKYYTSRSKPLLSINKTSQDENEVSYGGVMVLSENDSSIEELEEEIVYMQSDEIVDDSFFDTTNTNEALCNVMRCESSVNKLSYGHIIDSLHMEENVSNTKVHNSTKQVTLKKTCDDIATCKKEKENKYKEVTQQILYSTNPTDGVEMEKNASELLNDVTTESIMNKYRALIRNKSQLLESIVEYEDPETGTCYIIPIVEESKLIEDDEGCKQIQDIPESKENKNLASCQQNNTHLVKEVEKQNATNYDDIELKLAEIVGESLEGNENISLQKTNFHAKHKSNPVRVESFLSQPKNVDQKSFVISPTGKTNSGNDAKSQLEYDNISKNKSNKTITENSKLLKYMIATKDIDQATTHQKNSKRKMNSSDTKNNCRESKCQKDVTNDNKRRNTHECYKLSYNVEVEAISTPKINTDDVTCQLREVVQDYTISVKSSGIKDSSALEQMWRSKCNDVSEHRNNTTNTEHFQVLLPKVTYSKVTEQVKTRQKSLKRKIDAPDAKIIERKYRKGKNIDYPKFTAASLSETVYTKEYKSLLDYCSSVKFSFAVPFHKEHIDVHDKLKSWPLENTHPETREQTEEPKENIFADIEKSDALLDPLQQTLSEELNSQFDENSYTPSNIHETNFNMGFGERSGRVIQELKDGDFTTFSAATLSDVKQLQPLLPPDEKINILPMNCVDSKVHDQKLKAMRFIHHLNLREKVRSFFEKTKAELGLDWKYNSKKDGFENLNDVTNWPFGELTSTRSIRPCPVEITVNVVQVGQLPVSAAAQNPVTCDPRVTHVSNASPSQCSPGNNLGDELQTPIKTEYTELTTADITLPLMQEYVQNHSMPSDSQQPANIYGANDSTSTTTQIKSIVKIELMEETSQGNEEDNGDYENNIVQQLNGNVSSGVHYQFENVPSNVEPEADSIVTTDSSKVSKSTFSDDKQCSDVIEKPDQLAHAMNAAGISATKGIVKSRNSVDTIPQNTQPTLVTTSQTTTNNFSKGTSINAIALQQALAQILPSPLNQNNTSENNPQSSTNPQVLHIVQGNNAQSVINKPNGTQLLHIVQNKSVANTNGTPASQQSTFSGLSLVDGALQQSANQLLHIVNTTNPKNTNAGQLLKRVNLLTNLANVQGSNEQKMVQFVCKSADGKSIQLPHQRSMVLRLQPLDPPNVPNTPKQSDSNDLTLTSCTTHSVNEKESNPQEMKSRSLYEENYAKFVQNDTKFSHNGDSKAGSEKATSLPKFNQVFGKQVYQDKQSEIESDNIPENSETAEENNAPLEQISDITNPPMLIRKTNPNQPSHVQPNLVQHIKQTIGPMNIQTMHGGVIYTRQIPVNIGNGQTINLITVPSTDLVDDAVQKQQIDGKFGNQEGDAPIIKIVPTNPPSATPNGSTDDNNIPIRSTNETTPQANPQPQPVLTQMRIKLPMLSKTPQMVGGTRVVRPSFFQIQRNVIGGANQQVYQQLVLTAAPPLGQSIRLPAQVQKTKTTSETQSSPESQMSSSTLEQLREFDMVLEQVKERSTVQPGSSSTNNFAKLKSSPDTTDGSTQSTSTQESPTQVLYSVGNTQPLNVASYVNRKSTITSTTTSSFVRSPDSTGTVESPSSSTHSHLPHTITSDSGASSSCASEAAATITAQSKPKKKKPKPSTNNSNPFNIKNTPKPSSQKPLEDEQTTQRILYILAEYKEQVENSPDKDKPAPRRRNNPAAPNAGSSKRKKSSSGSRRRDMSPVLGEDSCRTMGSEDSSCGTSLGECNECLETHSPEESPKKVVRRLTFEQEAQVTQTRATTTTTNVPQRNVIVTDGQAFAVRGATGKPATTVLMPANYLLPVSMVKGGQQIAIVTNRGPKLLVGAGESGTGGTLLFQRLIGPGGLKPVLARPGVRHIRLPTAALHNLQAFNIATPAAANAQPPDSTASPAPAPTPPDLVDTRAMSSPWPDRDAGEVKPERGNSSPEGSEPWNLPSSSIADDYGYEEIVRTDNMDRTVLVVHRKDGRHTTRLTHVSAAALRHKYAILEHELRLQKSLSEECEDLGVDSPSASELFPEAELLFAPSPAHEQTIDQCHTPQPTVHTPGIPQPDLDDQIATDHLLTHKERHDDLDINLDDVGEIVTVGEDGMTTIPLDHEEFARSHEEFARSHPNTTFHSEPEDSEVPPFTIAQGVKGRQITFHTRGAPGTVVMAPQTTVISQATVEASGTQNPVKFSDIDNMINAMPSSQHGHINMPSVLKESNESLTKFDRLLNESRDLNLSNTTSAIVHSTGNGTQVIRRVQYERRDARYLVEDDAMIAGDSKTEERRDLIDDTSSSERHPELFWDTQSRSERKRFDFSSDSDKCCKSPYDETNSDSSGIGAQTRLDSVIKAARTERRRSDASSAEESHPPLRTYPPKRTHQHSHHTHHDVDRSVTGKTRASDRCHDIKDESRRRASNRGVVKRGCHCCNGSTPPKPKKSRPKKSTDYPHN